MIQSDNFKDWLTTNTEFSDPVITDTTSRIKRADGILEYTGAETYLFYLEREPEFRNLSISVRSQIRRAVRLYEAYLQSRL